MFKDKAKNPAPGGAPKMRFTREGSRRNNKHYTGLERLARGKHSSLFDPLV